MPPPEPRSRTVSPGLSFASAVGFPQPSEALKAASGICPACASSYRFEVIGSQQLSSAELAPQHPLLLPLVTRRAASPYFSLTISVTSIWTFLLLLAELEDGLRLNRLVAAAAFGIEEAEQLPQRVGVGRIPEIGAFPAYLHEVFVLELVEVMGERGGRNVQLRAHVAGDHALRMRREQQPHDAKAWLRSHCGKHIRIPHHVGFRFRFCHQSHSS